MKEIYKSAWQEDNGKFRVGDKILTESEFERLQKLMPRVRWILVVWEKRSGAKTVNFTEAAG